MLISLKPISEMNFEERFDLIKSWGCGTNFWELNISVKDLAAMLRVGKSTVLNWMRNEGLKYDLHGQSQLGRANFLWDDVEDFIETKYPEKLRILDKTAERIGSKHPLEEEL